MYKTVYILNDVPVLLTQEEYEETFSKEEIISLEEGKTINWVDKDNITHPVRLIHN